MSVEYGWLGRTPEPGPRVGLVVQAAYHLDEFVPLRDELRRRGIAADLLVSIPPKQWLDRFRPGVRRYRELLAASPFPLGGTVDERALVTELTGLVVMNDWGLPRALVASARGRGMPTFGWVEGVQDYGDVDTGQSRQPYRQVDHVFCLGRYGADQLGDASVTITGSTRLRKLWEADAGEAPSSLVTLNSNFTYGVLTDDRRRWLRSAVEACRSAGLPWVLSRHTAERGSSFPYRSDDRPISELLDRSSHFVGRFSTVCYEALVRGIEFAYHNPHGEKEPTFSTPGGAFACTTTTDELTAVLAAPPRSRDDVRGAAAAFLHHHLRLDPGEQPAVMAADEIEARLR